MQIAERRKLYVPAMPSVTTAELIPIIGYVRVSTWREDKISVDIQKDAINSAAARRGRYVAKWIEDPDKTGRNFKRKIMQGIQLVESDDNPLREIWVWKFSRFGRNRYGVAINLARIEHVGGELISATEDIDASTATGEFTRDMLFAVASFESNRAGEQWRETHELRRSMGLPATGRRRFGYLWHPRRVPDGEGSWTLQEEWYEALAREAEVSHEGYTMYIAGKIGFARLAQRWTGLGMLNAWGNPWQDQAVKTYLDSGFAAGLLRTHKRDVRCVTTHRCLNSEHWEYRPAEHEAIITGDEWDAYRDRREVRKGTPRRSLAPTYPLSGLVCCGVCRENGRQASCTPHSSGGYTPAAYYRCGMNSRGHVSHGTVRNRRDVVERNVYEWLLRVREEIDDIVAGRVVIPEPRTNPTDEVKRKRLKMEVSKFTAALDRAAEGHALDDIPRDTYLRTRDRLTKKRDVKQRELDALPKVEQPQQSPMPHRETVLGLIKEWDTISVISKRVMLGSLIRRVEMGLNRAVEVVPTWAPADEPLPTPRTAARRSPCPR